MQVSATCMYVFEFILQACKQSMDELKAHKHKPQLYPKPDRHDIHTDIGKHEFLKTSYSNSVIYKSTHPLIKMNLHRDIVVYQLRLNTKAL